MDQHKTYQHLLEKLADIERQQEDKTMSHSDQQLLDQAWEDTTNQLDALEELFETEEETRWQDAEQFFEDEDWVPPPPEPKVPKRNGKTVTFAPPPPSADEPWPRGPEVFMLSEEELDLMNAYEDNRVGCEHCAGCTYCFEGAGYDGADEV